MVIPAQEAARTGTVVLDRLGPTGASEHRAWRPSGPRQDPGGGHRRASGTLRRMSTPRTIVDNIWTDHVVSQDPGAPAVLAIDLHLVHEVTSPQAFSGLRARGIGVRRPGQTVATADHSIPTTDRSLPFIDQMR